ncbi:aminotransferase class I/II-fold pyridoxal phosphate-dependent enzyme [Tepidanaerobacter syntrophicus]|uniref:aminotransferase class I/II-fold pyridoxal phosphate-dependent enzyme n=1 Tax=Tepidanaerobacter syntrophicus TaxID=224999 RepID=UPI002354C546|nr:aminotransferase class I/II-fold pyridoxal phosphate-dependent enzyme [Tepidanaerobacter syntrophicus]
MEKQEINKFSKTPLIQALKEYEKKDSLRFHMPGHKGRCPRGVFCDIKENLFGWDVTEIPGLDDFAQPEGPIKEAQEKLSALYGADTSYFLVNGATSGIISMMAGALSEKDKILIPRTSHKSVLSGLILTGASAAYIMPERCEELGVYAQVEPCAITNKLIENPDIKAILVTNPVYQGFCPDIARVAEIAKERGTTLLADEAQGPHFGFSKKVPQSAGKFADAWVQSPHKMLTSLTQSAWLHIKGNRIDKERLEDFLHIVTTSSPSYILMASLDGTRELIEENGNLYIEKAVELAQKARYEINNSTVFYAPGQEILGKYGISSQDPLHLMVNVSCAGYTGYDIEKALREDFSIYAEYADLCNVYFLITFSNTLEDIKGLLAVLSHFKPLKNKVKPCFWIKDLPKVALEPKKAFKLPAKSVPLKDSAGSVSKRPLVPYPPGAPLVMPGEIIEKEHIEMINEILNSGGYCQGVTSEKFIQVVTDF